MYSKDFERQSRDEYVKKFGMLNVLTPDEKAKYSSFAQKVHNLPHKELFELNMGVADELTSEMKDIVSFEIKMRELEALKSKNINPDVAFGVDQAHEYALKEAERDYWENEDPTIIKLEQQNKKLKGYALEERQRLSEMSEGLLERSKQIINNHAPVVKKSDLHNMNGGGVNVLTKKYIVEDSNGERILVNNEKIQNHFRKMYIKRLSEVTGIDYTKYDNELDYVGSAEELYDTLDPNDKSDGWAPSSGTTNHNMDNSKQNLTPTVNLDDYEDD